MKNRIFILVALFIMPLMAFSAEKNSIIKDVQLKGCATIDVKNKKLNLIELINIGICNNPALRAEYMSIEVADSQLDQAKSQYMPSISLNSSANTDRADIQNRDKIKSDNYSGSLSLSWLLFDFGGRSSKYDSYKINVAINKFSYNEVLYDTILSIHTAYLNLLGSEESLKSALENEKAFKKSYEESSRKYKLGMVSLNDKLQAQTQYKKSTLIVVEKRNNVKQYSGYLAVLLNLIPTTKFNLIDPPTDQDLTILKTEDNVDKMIEMALLNRDSIQKQENKLLLSKKNIDIAKANMAPTIALAGNVGYNDSFRNENNDYKKNASIGINFSMPIFRGFETINKISQAKFEYQQAKFKLDEEKNNVAREVWSAYQNYKASLESYNISKQVLQSAEENLKVSFKSYEIGKTDIINLLTANSTLADARQNKVNAFYTVLINKANLYRAIGRF